MANEAEIVGATVAGKYRIRRVVGGGSMGVVCEAEHLEIGKRVAIKLIDASLAGMTDIAMRFRQEARATSLVESQHIVQVFDVGTDERLGLYLVMEYLTGEDLAKVLGREKQLSLRTAVQIGVQVARGLAKAHEAGVVHRDLKPANIFLCTSEDDQPLVKILDFGISKVVDSSRMGSAPGLKLTRDGMVVGTPQYMSPEQAQGFAIDERTDVWALGLVLYEMLAGRPAYPELPTYEQFIINLVSKAPDPLRQSAPWVPDDIANVVHGAIEHDLTKRIPSCADLIKRLEGTSAATAGRRQRSMGARLMHPGSVPEPIVSETTDTWSDPRSFDSERPGASSVGGAFAVPNPRVQVRSETREPGEPQSSLRAFTIERRRDPSLPSSGVRSTAPDAQLALEDSEDDAPQFFDRKSFQTLGPPSSSLSQGAVVAPLDAALSSAPGPSRLEWVRRLRWGWLGLALLVLAALATFALR